MPTRRRKIEVHRLTISGLGKPAQYTQFLHDLSKAQQDLSKLVRRHGEKSHALHSSRIASNRIRLRFLSFVTGHRPDILDTKRFALQPNPLSAAQTGVEWTHVLGGLVDDRYSLIIERVQSGIAPGAIEDYLQWFIDSHGTSTVVPDGRRRTDPITVSIEAEPGEEFLTRLDALQRVTKATVRTVRPNPGWHDLDKELAEEADQSDAHRAEVSMTARRGASLNKRSGILQAVRSLFRRGNLNYAAIEGERGDQKESFNTTRLSESRRVNLELDDHGQVKESDAWDKMSDLMDDLG